MIAAAIAVTILVALAILVHYEVLRLASVLIPEERHVRPRARVVLVVFACFAAHTIEVWLFALAYYLFVEVFGLGSFGGTHNGSFVDNIYFSVVSYTSLGFGDVYPIDNVRLISGVEALVGLLMIGWSASFTYLAMEKFWPMHGDRVQRLPSARSLRGRHTPSRKDRARGE